MLLLQYSDCMRAVFEKKISMSGSLLDNQSTVFKNFKNQFHGWQKTNENGSSK